MVWSYDWIADKVEERSVAVLMAKYDLYTQQTAAGPDVSLETGELAKVDTNGAMLFRRLDDGDRGPALREELADFFSVMALRHPATVVGYPLVAANFVIKFQEYLNVANSIDDFHSVMDGNGLGNIEISEDEFNIIKNENIHDVDTVFGQIFDSFLASGGNQDVPFSHVITDPSGREDLKNRLLSMEWNLGRSKRPKLVIGDAGVMFQHGDSDLGWKAVLGPDLAMLITKQKQPISSMIGDVILEKWQVDNLNMEMVARSERFLVGSSKRIVEKFSQYMVRNNA
ncbi:uncharacterized protein DUF4238 [Nitrospirillum viridazoti]|uniref:Uncharacterized protein DUF4238 n=2 Tax=Nitrospirillum TaxID=1543705 RepID=A0A560IBD4_9PROT|nr:uncharacterized protein DUF4238 [Nitrospirillum amazonense]